MQDDEITLFNGCTDLVGLRKCEAFPLRLLQGKRSGEWVRVDELCSQVGVAAGELKAELFATWLPDPTAHEAYAMILFYDEESKRSMAAHYNRRRLLEEATAEPSPRPIRAARPAASGSTSPQAWARRDSTCSSSARTSPAWPPKRCNAACTSSTAPCVSTATACVSTTAASTRSNCSKTASNYPPSAASALPISPNALACDADS